MEADLFSHRPFASLIPLRHPKLEEYARRARGSGTGGGGARDALPRKEATDIRLLGLGVPGVDKPEDVELEEPDLTVDGAERDPERPLFNFELERAGGITFTLVIDFEANIAGCSATVNGVGKMSSLAEPADEAR